MNIQEKAAAPSEGGREGVKLSAPMLLLAFIWWYFFLEREHQRIFLCLVAVLKFAEYFYHLPSDLEQYQDEDWWDVPTIKTALMTMGVFWLLAYLSSTLPFSSWTAKEVPSSGQDRSSKRRRRRNTTSSSDSEESWKTEVLWGQKTYSQVLHNPHWISYSIFILQTATVFLSRSSSQKMSIFSDINSQYIL